MYCPQCQQPNPDSAVACSNCGHSFEGAVAPPQGAAPPPHTGAGAAPTNNYLIPAILTTVFCCLPTGIAAIIYAAQVNGKVQAGDIAGAQEAAKNAKLWSWISFGVGFVVIALYLLLAVVGGIASEM